MVTITAVLGALNNTATMTVVLPTITNLRYAAPVEYAVGALAAGPVIGDLNGDGKPDVVISDINANTVIFFKGNGDGTFTRGASIGSGASQPYTNTKPVDLNGDGKLDVIASNYASGSVSVFLGNGAGAFRYLFPIHQARHPVLTMSHGERRYWEHAHNDLVQFPIELGAAGCALVLLCFCHPLAVLIRHRFWANPLATGGVLGLLSLLAYAWWDFPFQCPAILVTWCALWPAIALWVRFEEP